MSNYKDFDRIQVLLADIDVSSVKLDRIANQADSAVVRNSAADARRALVLKLEEVLAGIRLELKGLK